MPRPLTFPLRLSTVELAYLLATLRASSLPGIPLSSLLPEDAEARREQLRRGYEALREQGWIEEVEQEGRTYMDLNSYLLEYVAALANPQVVIQVAWTSLPEATTQVIWIVVSPLKVISVGETEDGIVLLPLASEEEIATILAQWLDIPASAEAPSWHARVSEEEVRLLKEGAAPPPGWEIPELWHALVDTYAHPRVMAEIRVAPADAGRLQEAMQREWRLLVGGGKTLRAWLIEAEGDMAAGAGWHYRICHRPCFREVLHQALAACRPAAVL